MIAVQVSVAEGRLRVRPMNQVTAEVLHHPPSNQPRGWQSRGLPATPVSRQPQRSEPSHAADLQRWSRVLKRCVPHVRSMPTPGPAAGALVLRTGCWLHPGLQTGPHLPKPPSASPAAGAAPFTSAAKATLPRPA